MTLGAIKSASTVKYCVAGFVNANPLTWPDRWFIEEKGEEQSNLCVSRHKAVLNSSEMTSSESYKLPLQFESLVHTRSGQYPNPQRKVRID